MAFAYSGAMIGQLVHAGRRPGLRLHSLGRADLGVALSSGSPSSRPRHVAPLRPGLQPWIWGYAAVVGTDLSYGRAPGHRRDRALDVDHRSVGVVDPQFVLGSKRGAVASPTSSRWRRARVGVRHRSGAALPGGRSSGFSQRSSISYSFFGAVRCGALDVATLRARHLRRNGSAGTAQLLRPLQLPR